MFEPVKIIHEQCFKPTHIYYGNGYKLYFDRYWRLTYKKSDKVQEREIMTDSTPNFLDICRELELKPFKTIDTIGEDSDYSNQIAENISSWRAAFPDDPDIEREELEAYREIDKSFSVYESVNGY